MIRVAPAVGSLRRRKMYQALREATITAAMRERFRIIHVSLQRTHIHMLVEADHKVALARGMQGFQISAARNINTALGDGKRRRRGKVFWRRHREDREGIAATWLVDPFSTGILFPDWKELQDKALMWPIRATYDPFIVYRPRSWLLAEGWKRGGGPISARDVPSRSR